MVVDGLYVFLFWVEAIREQTDACIYHMFDNFKLCSCVTIYCRLGQPFLHPHGTCNCFGCRHGCSGVISGVSQRKISTLNRTIYISCMLHLIPERNNQSFIKVRRNSFSASRVRVLTVPNGILNSSANSD